MRKQLIKALATTGFLIAIAMVTVGSAQAQSLGYGIKVNVPFDFTVADKKLPAGEYKIRRLQQYASDSVLMVSSVDGRTLAVRMTSAVRSLDPKTQTKVVFHRYGDEHFLFQVWPAGANTGRALVKSRNEREAEQRARNSQVTGRNTKVLETVSIVGALSY